MLDLILKLIDHCIELVKRKEQTNRSLFTDFVAPALADFEVVHKGYVDTFRKYRQLIETSHDFTELKRKLLDEIKVDNLFSDSDRAKLRELQRWAHDPVIGDFILAILRYIRLKHCEPRPTIESYDLYVPQMMSQQIRSSTGRAVIQGIERSVPKERRKAALEALDYMLSKVQNNYDDVIHEYSTLKDKLLRPI